MQNIVYTEQDRGWGGLLLARYDANLDQRKSRWSRSRCQRTHILASAPGTDVMQNAVAPCDCSDDTRVCESHSSAAQSSPHMHNENSKLPAIVDTGLEDETIQPDSVSHRGSGQSACCHRGWDSNKQARTRCIPMP
jgi:hypothetical protein